MSDWSLPTLTSLYSDVLLNIGGRLDDATKMNRTGGGTVASAVTLTNPPVGTVRWNSGSAIWEANTGTGATSSVPVWEALASTYGITVSKANQWTTTRTIALTGDATATATNIDGSANVSLATTLASIVTAQGPTGSATAVPIITIDAKGRVTAMSTAALGSIAVQAANSVAITGGAISGTALTLEQSTTFANTAEGRIGWDTDDDVMTVGTGAATKVFAPLAPTNAVTATNYTFSTSCNWNGNAVPIAYGGTGAADAATARTNLGLSTMATQASTAVSVTGGAISGTALTLVQSTTAAPTAEGRIEWDTDDDVITVGTGAATKVFAPLSPTAVVTAVNYTFSTGCTWGGNAIPVANGGTGATSAGAALSNLGAAAAGQTMYIGTTAVTINRGSASISLTGVSIDGSAGTLGGNAPNTTGGASTIVQRDASGYIQNNYFYTSGGGSERNVSGQGYFAGFNTGDYYIRSYTAAAAAALLSGQTMNIAGSSTSCSGNSATVTHNAGRTDATAYPVVWMSGANSPAYSCSSVTITSSTGQLSAGIIYSSGNVTAYSDERVKTNWRGYGPDFVLRLSKVLSGTYDRTDIELTQDGVGAQSLRPVMPNSVIEDESGKLSVAYGQAAMAACVELAKKIVELEARLAALGG